MPKGSENSEPEQSQSSEHDYEAAFFVEAWQNITNSEVPEPEWLGEARQMDAVRPYPDARDGALQLCTPFGRPRIEHGDWIVRLPSGRLTIWPDADFRECFVKAD